MLGSMRVHLLLLQLLFVAVTVVSAASQSDIDVVARTIYGEARGESYQGQVAVAWVIKNRAINQSNMGRFWRRGQRTSSSRSPVYNAARKRYQFSCWNACSSDSCLRLETQYQTIARGVLDNTIADPTNQANMYYAARGPSRRSFPPAWGSQSGYTHTINIGNHNFYQDKNAGPYGGVMAATQTRPGVPIPAMRPQGRPAMIPIPATRPQGRPAMVPIPATRPVARPGSIPIPAQRPKARPGTPYVPISTGSTPFIPITVNKPRASTPYIPISGFKPRASTPYIPVYVPQAVTAAGGGNSQNWFSSIWNGSNGASNPVPNLFGGFSRNTNAAPAPKTNWWSNLFKPRGSKPSGNSFLGGLFGG